jgi:hypothetical protein
MPKTTSTKAKAAPASADVPVLARTPAIGVLTDGPAMPDTVAHRKTRTTPLRTGPSHSHKGDPSTAWPACMAMPKPFVEARWREYGAAFAHELGAIGCTHAKCFPDGP